MLGWYAYTFQFLADEEAPLSHKRNWGKDCYFISKERGEAKRDINALTGQMDVPHCCTADGEDDATCWSSWPHFRGSGGGEGNEAVFTSSKKDCFLFTKSHGSRSCLRSMALFQWWMLHIGQQDMTFRFSFWLFQQMLVIPSWLSFVCKVNELKTSPRLCRWSCL